MAIVFPISPSVNDTFTAGSITYKWDGDKWIGLGVTPADKLVEGSNKLEINASNQLVWSGDDIIQSSANKSFKSNSTSSGDYVRMYAGGGTAQWDIYGNGELLRMGDNSSSATAKVQFDNPTFHRSTATTTGVAALTAKQEVNNGGYLIFDGKNSSDTTVFSVSHNGRVAVSDGIDFSANGNAAGMDSELLDDYEEGNWTPTLTGSSGGSGQVYGVQEGQYTKIGNLVVLRFNITLTTLGTFSGPYPLIAGFPFNVEGNNTNGVNTVGGGLVYHVALGSSVIALGTQLWENNDRAYFWAKTAAGPSREYIAGGSLFAVGTQLTGTITYQT